MPQKRLIKRQLPKKAKHLPRWKKISLHLFFKCARVLGTRDLFQSKHYVITKKTLRNVRSAHALTTE